MHPPGHWGEGRGFSWFVSLPVVPSLPPAPPSSLCTAHTGWTQGINTTDGVSPGRDKEEKNSLKGAACS